MQKKTSFSSDRLDRTLLAVSLLAICICTLLLTSETAYNFLAGSRSSQTSGPIIGQISFTHNDVRLRSSSGISWEKAKNKQGIRAGDSVFTAEQSQIRIGLKDGGQIDLDQNSLVKFDRVGGIEVPNLSLGNFRLAVTGKMKVVLNGELTELEGNGSEVQVFINDQGKANLKVIKGEVIARVKNSVRRLDRDRFVSVDEISVKPRVENSVDRQVAGETKQPQLVLHDIEAPFVHTDHLYDFFEPHADGLRRRKARRLILENPVAVAWTVNEQPPVRVFGQLSRDPSFLSILDTFAQDAGANQSHFKKSSLGKNYYRISSDGQTWQVAKSFTVSSFPLSEAPPRLKANRTQLVIVDAPVTFEARILSEMKTFVVEMSESVNFPAARTRVYWHQKPEFNLTFSEAQSFYLRVRGVNAQYQLTASSEPMWVEVSKPLIPSAPVLAQDRFQLRSGDEWVMAWDQVPRAENYRVRVLDQQGQVVVDRKSTSPALRMIAPHEGQYQVQIEAIDVYGRSSNEKTLAELQVTPRPQKRHSLDRIPAETTASVSEKIDLGVPNYLNREFSSSKLSMEGAVVTLISKDQISQGGSNPVSMMIGLRWFSWFGDNGLEASFKTKAVDVTTADSSVSPLQLEARYHHRWTVGFNPFSEYKKSEIGLVGGFEYYRNPTSGLFSSGYDLVKGGVRLAFPLMENFDTGGEVIYGKGLESSSKYEISGYLNYYLERNWSLGMGYRIHLFEAGSDKVSPLGLPYREGFGEGYSVFRWHY